MKKLIGFLLILAMLCGMGCTALADSGSDDLMECANETLIRFSSTFNDYILSLASASVEEADEAIDFVVCNGVIKYDENSFNYGDSGVGVVSGGAYSVNNTITMGMGSGIDEDEDLWYVSLTFSPEASDVTLASHALAFILSCGELGMELADDPDEYVDAAIAIADILFSAEEPIAIESNGMVLLHKDLGGGTHLLAVDSVEYYDEFYYNDIENYLVAD